MTHCHLRRLGHTQKYVAKVHWTLFLLEMRPTMTMNDQASRCLMLVLPQITFTNIHEQSKIPTPAKFYTEEKAFEWSKRSFTNEGPQHGIMVSVEQW